MAGTICLILTTRNAPSKFGNVRQRTCHVGWDHNPVKYRVDNATTFHRFSTRPYPRNERRPPRAVTYQALEAARLALSAIALILLMTPLLSCAHAQQITSTKEADELEQKITRDILNQLPQEIMKVLFQTNLLNHQIAHGIEAYFYK